MSPGAPLILPDLRSLLDTERQNAFSAFNAVKIGQVVQWTPGKQSTRIQIVVQRVVANTPQAGSALPAAPQIIAYPILVDVPTFVLSGGGAFLGMPIAPGDMAIVLFNDHDLDPWWSSGATGAAPNTSRTHSLADGIAIVGIRPATKPIANLPSDGQHMTFGNASGTFLAAMNLLFTALTSWVDTGGQTPNPATVVLINNAKTAMAALFQ